MQIKSCIAVMTTVSMLVTPSLFAADAGPIHVTPVACVSATQHPRVVATVPPTAKSARVFFEAEGQLTEYYIDMRRGDNGNWWAFLPMPEKTTHAIVYRGVWTDGTGAQTSSAVLTTTVTQTCDPQSLTADQLHFADNLAVGLTTKNQSPVPTGFQCPGVVSYITVANELLPNNECRGILAAALAGPGSTTAAGTGAAGAAGAGGMSAATLGALAAVGLGAVGYAVYNNNKSNNKTSPSRP
jgi:hypothetical protein